MIIEFTKIGPYERGKGRLCKGILVVGEEKETDATELFELIHNTCSEECHLGNRAPKSDARPRTAYWSRRGRLGQPLSAASFRSSGWTSKL